MANVTGRRLGEITSCPRCKTEVNPVVIENVPPKFHIPARVVLQCPTCDNVWYAPYQPEFVKPAEEQDAHSG